MIQFDHKGGKDIWMKQRKENKAMTYTIKAKLY